jgi:hypothetical protein
MLTDKGDMMYSKEDLIPKRYPQEKPTNYSVDLWAMAKSVDQKAVRKRGRMSKYQSLE